MNLAYRIRDQKVRMYEQADTKSGGGFIYSWIVSGLRKSAANKADMQLAGFKEIPNSPDKGVSYVSNDLEAVSRFVKGYNLYPESNGTHARLGAPKSELIR